MHESSYIDGRDCLDESSFGFVETLENDLAELRKQGVDALIASGRGRMYVTMDCYEVAHVVPFFSVLTRNHYYHFTFSTRVEFLYD